jgi:release factor glutamine methyltransferase
MTIVDWLTTSMTALHQAGIENGRTDCLVLLADHYQKDKSWVHTHPEFSMNANDLSALNFKLGKRLQRTPLAYIRGFIEFYGRDFAVNSRVLIPRPESESFISLIKEIPDLELPHIADIGTGSGCLGITAGLEIPQARVHLYDIDQHALEVARHNARKYMVNATFTQSNMLSKFDHDTKHDVILANLPYVPNNLITSPEIEAEPALALFSGKDGLQHYRLFWSQINSFDGIPPKYILTEALIEQHSACAKMALDADYALVKTDLLVQLFQRNY